MVKWVLLLSVLFPSVCHGFIHENGTEANDWDGLRVTWGWNPRTAFQALPRTLAEAVATGWVPMVTGTTCDSNPLFLGEQYWKDDDLAVILLFDTNGYIAGIQAAIPKDYPNNPNKYPFPELIDRPFILDGNNYYITAYFVDPATVCVGRSEAQFEEEGTGTGLWIQNGRDPISDSVRIPDTEEQAAQNLWSEGVCFPSMGVHYWYNVTQHTSCNDFFPVFAMYNNGVLNSFGWAFGMNIEPSNRFEHPPPEYYNVFLKEVPACFYDMGTLTTQHIYLTDDVFANNC